MTPVFQDRFGRGNGNCMQAAVASLLDLSLAEVPNFSNLDAEWFEGIMEWALSRNLGVLHFSAPGNGSFIGNGAFAVGIWTVEGTHERHAVVVRFDAEPQGDGKWKYETFLVHDPNPRSPELLALEEVVFFLRP